MRRPEAVFSLFACCLPVQGARRSLVCDLQRQSFQFIPNGLYEILTEHAGKTAAGIKAAYDHEYDEEIDEYFEFLLGHEFGFWCADPERFPALDLTWEAPERITNAILDVDRRSDHDYAKIFRELDDLGCKALELRCFESVPLPELRRILDEHGPDALSFYVSGQLTMEAQYLANKLAKGYVGTNQIESNSRLCMASAASGYKLSLGREGQAGLNVFRRQIGEVIQDLRYGQHRHRRR